MGAELKYRTFESLRADVESDFKNLTLENLIEPQELIRAARWVTADLGLKIYKTKNAILELHHGRVRLPDDFFVFNFGLLCGEGVIRTALPQGVRIETIPYPFPIYQEMRTVDQCAEECPVVEVSDCGGCGSCKKCNGIVLSPGYNPVYPLGDPCVQPRIFLDCKGDAFELIQVVQTEIRHWKAMLPLRLVSPTHQISSCCPNLYVYCKDEVWIKDGFLHSNLSCGTIYMNYEGNLEDDEGNMLVPDHELLNPFYEYKLKDKIYEVLSDNGEDVERRMDRNAIRLRFARSQAQSVVNMPEISEIANVYKLNRQAYNVRYVDMFKSCNWIGSYYGGRIW